jgi:hypothetical protein
MHKNSYQNEELHHLYEIIDRLDESVFKYGISCMPIDEDNISSRMREQVNFLNLVDQWNRFYARILIKNIEGKKEARKLETQHILEHQRIFGDKPRGNITL